MSESTAVTLPDRARDAAGRGEWHEAYDLLIEADAGTPLAGAELGLLADVAYAAGHLDVTIGAWERAHSASMLAGDHPAAAAAAVRVAMHLLFDTAFMAPVRAWIRRADRLLARDSETPVHAWLAVVRNYERMLSGDFATARRWARQAIEIGTRCDPAAAAVGRVAEARSLILAGEMSEGLALLDEAAVTTTSGELDPLFTGIVYCEVVCALQAVAQYDQAQEWTAAMEGWRHGKAVGSIHGRCRVHRAEILRLRGSCDEAEREALSACEELRPYLRRELGWPLTELGRIRLRKGDLTGAAEAFRAAHEVGWDPQPGLALVHLARGETASAANSIRDALEHPRNVPSKEYPPNTELRRAPLLEAQVEIAVAAGDLPRARSAAEELSRVAVRFESRALGAGAALARGRVSLAEGDHAGGRREFEAALTLWAEIGAPYETATARLGLAHAHRAGGNRERALFEFQTARTAFERIGAAHMAAKAARECGHSETDGSPDSERTADRENVFRCEGDHWCVAFGGRTVRMRDRKGLHYLARLLASPGRELHVLDLAAGTGGALLDRAPDPALDAEAMSAYRRRLAEIDEDIEEADALGDAERIGQAEGEREFLARELARAVGLGGRRRNAGSASERARAAVTRAIRQAMTRINEHHPAVGEHLERAIRTGTYCVYLPDSRVRAVWRT